MDRHSVRTGGRICSRWFSESSTSPSCPISSLKNRTGWTRRAITPSTPWSTSSRNTLTSLDRCLSRISLLNFYGNSYFEYIYSEMILNWWNWCQKVRNSRKRTVGPFGGELFRESGDQQRSETGRADVVDDLLLHQRHLYADVAQRFADVEPQRGRPNGRDERHAASLQLHARPVHRPTRIDTHHRQHCLLPLHHAQRRRRFARLGQEHSFKSPRLGRYSFFLSQLNPKIHEFIDWLICLTDSSIDQGMYQYISTSHLLLMVRYLAKSHHFARQFNTNASQRNVLWKAGFRGSVRPNLLKQETQSLACALRILFRLYDDETRRHQWPDVAEKLTQLGQEALEYYVTLETESHRDAWSPLMLLFLSRVTHLSDDKVIVYSYYSFESSTIISNLVLSLQFRTHISRWHQLLCELVSLELKPELRSLLRKIFLRVGQVFNILAPNAYATVWCPLLFRVLDLFWISYPICISTCWVINSPSLVKI